MKLTITHTMDRAESKLIEEANLAEEPHWKTTFHAQTQLFMFLST